MLALQSKEQAARMETKRPTTYRYMRTLFLVETGGGDGGGETPILGVRIASLLANPEGEDQGKESDNAYQPSHNYDRSFGMETEGSRRR